MIVVGLHPLCLSFWLGCTPSALLQVADRLEAAVNKCLDDGLRTGDIYKAGAGRKLTKCSEMVEALLKNVSA